MHIPYGLNAALLIDVCIYIFLFSLCTERVKQIFLSFLDKLGFIFHPLSCLGYYMVYLAWYAIRALSMIMFAVLNPFYL